MAVHSYGLRSKFNNIDGCLKITPNNSPLPRSGSRSPRKTDSASASISLQHVIGTTTSNPSGLSCHASSNTYAYCAGSAAVVAKVEPDGKVTQRFYKARPTASSINPHSSFYDNVTPSGTPTTRRRSVLPTQSNGHRNSVIRLPRLDRTDDGNMHTWTARERIKAATCVSLSPDGRFLALGETGYNPRVLIFSTADDALTEIPLSIMTDHSFGVRSVAFSPDSRYLATLGEPNDGFLFIWTVNLKTGMAELHSTNKCTTNVCDMVWCGNNVITVGTRHIKVWKIPEIAKLSSTKRGRLRSEAEEPPASPAPKALCGRNCLLGSLADSTFSCAAPVSSREAVVCTDSGQICLLTDCDGELDLKLVKSAEFGIGSVTVRDDIGKFVIAGRHGRMHTEEIACLRGVCRPAKGPGSAPASPREAMSSPKLLSSLASSRVAMESRSIVAVGSLSSGVVTVFSDSSVRISQDNSDSPEDGVSTFASHGDSVQGLQFLPTGESFFTWSRSGSIKIWENTGKLLRSVFVNLDQVILDEDDCDNELRVVRYSPSTDYFFCGDRLGVLKVIRNTDWSVAHEVRAHGADITDIAFSSENGVTLLATCARDRMVQLFRLKDDDLELAQTMDDHIGAVNQLLFTASSSRLLSSSSDRTIIIRERITREVDGTTLTAYLASKVVTLKASPTSMALVPGQTDLIAVSTMDRHIVKLNILSGAVADAFKAADPENDDTVVLNSISLSRASHDATPRVLVGYSPVDKSIRVYDFDRNILLTRDSGHTEGISDVSLKESLDGDGNCIQRSVISTGLDGTIMIWKLSLTPPQFFMTPMQELSQSQATLGYDSDGSPVKLTTASLPPLRKILTKMDIVEFTRADPAAGSPIPVRDYSPTRLRRKTSRVTMSASRIDENEAIPFSSPARSPKLLQSALSPTKPVATNGRSGSPSPLPPSLSHRPIKQRSRTQLSIDFDAQRDADNALCRRSASPPLPLSMPSTPRGRTGSINRANNGPLRRPPSVPNDLRTRALAHTRRKSVTATAAAPPPASAGATAATAAPAPAAPSEFGSIAAANEQVCRMLKSHRKRVLALKERDESGSLDFEEVERELQASLDVLHARRRTRLSAVADEKKGVQGTPGDLSGNVNGDENTNADESALGSATVPPMSPAVASGLSTATVRRAKATTTAAIPSAAETDIDSLAVLLQQSVLAEQDLGWEGAS